MSTVNPLAADLHHVLEHTRPLWEQLRGERVFITGGSGFFGKWLLDSFLFANDYLRLGSRAVVLSRDPDAFRRKSPQLADNPAMALVPGDARSFAFPAGAFSHVMHAATETSSGPIEPAQLFRANVDATTHMLAFLERCHARKLVFTSSGAVYGRQPSDLTHVPEDYAGAPDTMDRNAAYGHSKRATEYLLTAGAPAGLEVKIARCFAFVGPGLPLDANYAIGNFIRDTLAGKPIHIQGDGTPFRSYLYAADLAIWLWTILFEGKPARPYNVGSDRDVTICQLAEEVARVVRTGTQVVVAGTPRPDQPAQRYVPSIARARAELGLDVWVPLDEAVRRTANFYSR